MSLLYEKYWESHGPDFECLAECSLEKLIRDYVEERPEVGLDECRVGSMDGFSAKVSLSYKSFAKLFKYLKESNDDKKLKKLAFGSQDLIDELIKTCEACLENGSGKVRDLLSEEDDEIEVVRGLRKILKDHNKASLADLPVEEPGAFEIELKLGYQEEEEEDSDCGLEWLVSPELVVTHTASGESFKIEGNSEMYALGNMVSDQEMLEQLISNEFTKG